MTLRTVESLGDLRGKRVLVRSDLNVPLEGTQITDPGRIVASAPQIRALAEAGAKVIVCAHLGRPKGEPEEKYSLKPLVEKLSDEVGKPITFATDTVGESARAAVAAMQDGDVVLLENLRFNAGETAKDDAERGAFADQLAELCDVFVSDGFGVVHRKQASVYDIAQKRPSAAGKLVQTEVEVMKRLTENPERPYTVVLGGSKVSDKLGVIDNLLQKADRLVIAGGMGYTFLKAQGYEIGTSLLEEDQVERCEAYLKEANRLGKEIVLPVDVVTAAEFNADADREDYPVGKIPADRMGLDLGPESRPLFAEKIQDSRTVFWNGPLGVFEFDRFSFGTRLAALELADLTASGEAFTVVGGGDSAAAVRKFGYRDDQFGHISTGGGASLEYLEGKELPGLTVLEG